MNLLIISLFLSYEWSAAWIPSAASTRPLHTWQLNLASTTTSSEPILSSPSPIGLALDDLSRVLGGRGRALSCWECFRNGVDPLWYFGSNSEIEPRVPQLQRSGWFKDDLDLQGQFLGRKAQSVLQTMPRIETDIARMTHLTKSLDGTTKLLLQLADGLEVETVIIPWDDREKSTLCISSQVGCRQGCTFCATGRMGILRSLSRDEILAQVYWANKVCRIENLFSVDNIVFMGMGEPADNAHEVVPAATSLVDRNMFGMASRRVTISTVAPTPDSFLELAEAPVVLAWSVHATRQAVRQALVPTTKYPMEELRSGLLKALEGRSRSLRSIMLEVTLISGVNDSYEDAMDLINFCRPIEEKSTKLVVNLIPWNNIGASSGTASYFQQPKSDQVFAFQKVLTDHGIRCYVRTTRGDDESSACGQLATKKFRQQMKP